MHHAGVTGYDRTPGRLSLTRAPSLRAISDPVDDLRFRRGHHSSFDACGVGSAPTRSGDLPATRWAAHQRTKICTQTFPEYPLLFEKAVICLFSHGPVAWPLLGRRCWWPYPSPRRHSQRTRAPGHLTPRPGGQPLGYIRESAACASTHTLGVGWSPVPGHAGHQRHCPTPRPAVSLRGSLQAGH